MGDGGRRPARRGERPVRVAPRPRGPPAAHAAAGDRRRAVRRGRRRVGPGDRGARGVLRALPPAGRPRHGRPRRRARVRRHGRPTSALIMLLTLPLVPVFMWLIGRYTEQRTREQWSALRRLSTPFPRRRARAADAARVRPRPRAAGDHRRGRGGAPPRDDGDAAGRVPVGLGARARRDARRRARRGRPSASGSRTATWRSARA